MAFENKVIWKEGMFIRAQHFQQDGRYLERFIRSRTAALRSYGWGLTELRLNRELLSTGRFAVERVAGIFQDGTPFAVPGDANHPPPLQIPENTRNCIVYLTLPISQPGGYESDASTGDSNTRYVSAEIDVPDNNVGNVSSAAVVIGKLRLGYALESSDHSGLQSIGLARIVEVRSDSTVVLDDGYVPPILDSQIAPFVASMLAEVVGLLNHRGEAIAARLSAGSTGTAAEMIDTLMLQAINRWQPVFTHLASASTVHPEAVYLDLIGLAGELATFTSQERRPREFPAYRHDQLQPTFAAVVAALRQALSAVLEQGAVAVPLIDRGYGIRVAQVSDRSIYGKYSFILAAKASLAPDVLVRNFTGQVKVGPVEQIRELVQSSLPGVMIRNLPSAPRQIPHHTGKVYFQLDKSSPLWRQVITSSAMAMHVAGDFPGLELELWAVKD